jgi:glycosyltransferase involved in cell wall biosynthesis
MSRSQESPVTEPSAIELSVVLPAFNEGAAVAHAIERYCAALPQCCRDFELLVIDDGSRDDTRAVAERAAGHDPRVRVLVNEKNMGQAATLLRGFAETRGQIIMHNGIDLPFDPADTGRVLNLMREGADVVVVQRIDRQAYGLFRKLVSRCNVLLLRALFGSPFRDHNFVQAYRRCVIEAIPVESRGVATVTPELIVKALAAGYTVRAVDAPYHRRQSGKSTITLKRIFHTANELVRLRVVLGRRPLSRRHGAAANTTRSSS